jgi:hypothetical protein
MLQTFQTPDWAAALNVAFEEIERLKAEVSLWKILAWTFAILLALLVVVGALVIVRLGPVTSP